MRGRVKVLSAELDFERMSVPTLSLIGLVREAAKKAIALVMALAHTWGPLGAVSLRG